ncbi:hypothetical protein AGMMS49991_06830 [Spirochaetia bacterium]|nr:hypothetical protein AGMMS49991_06830 [Spirochaetia bacterium]
MTNRLKNAIQKTADVNIGALSTVTVYKDVIVRIKKLAYAMDGKIDMTFEDNTFKFYRPNGKYFAKNVLGKSDGVSFKTEKVKAWQDEKKKTGREHPPSDFWKPITLTIGVSDNGYVVAGDYCLDCLEKIETEKTEVTMKKITLDKYDDPAHGWLKVSKAIIAKYGMESKISPYSYMSKDFVYCEEDMDAGTVLYALEADGYTVEVKYHITDNRSHIRSMASYRSPDFVPPVSKPVIISVKKPAKRERMVADRPMAVSRPKQRRNEPGNGWRYADKLQTRQVLKCKW